MIIYFFKNVFTILKYNKFRTVLTGLGIMVGVSSVVIISSLSSSFSNDVSKKIDDKIIIGIESKNDSELDYQYVMNSEDIIDLIDEVNDLPYVKSFEPMEKQMKVDAQLMDLSWRNDLTITFDNNVLVYEGRGFDSYSGNVVIINKSTDENSKSFANINDKIYINNIEYSVIGVTNDYSSDIFFPESLKKQVLYREINETGAFYLTMNNSDENLVMDLLNKLNMESNDYEFVNYSEINIETINEVFSSLTMFLSLIASISLIVSSINIINIMYISVLERRTEIAIYSALGMSIYMIAYVFLVETCVIVVMFSLIGYLLGLLIAYIIVFFLNFSFAFNIYNLLLTLMFTIVLGILSGIYPAIKAVKINPTELL